MIRTHILPCHLPLAEADALNLASGRIYSGIVSRHWRLLKQKGLWLSQKSLTKLSDLRWSERDLPLHAHTIDAAQQGFFKACRTTRALRKAGQPEAHFPWHTPKYRTTIWKNTSFRHRGATLELSNGTGNPRLTIPLPTELQDVLRFLEVRLVFDKRDRRYAWHVVIENGRHPKVSSGTNVVSVDPGEIHPVVIGDEHGATIITCRERRHEMQGQAKRLASLTKALSRKQRGSRAYKKLVRAKSRMKAKHNRVMRDMEHKISREVVDIAVELGAATIVYGDVRDVADEVALGKRTNQKVSGWNHGKVRGYVEYKAAAEGIAVELQNECYTSQTCPQCGERHKPRGRVYRCPSCGSQAHRDHLGQVNILSAYKYGVPGKIPVPLELKHREPYSIRRTRRRLDTGRVAIPVAWLQSQEAAGL
jgi:putative transposase